MNKTLQTFDGSKDVGQLSLLSSYFIFQHIHGTLCYFSWQVETTSAEAQKELKSGRQN